MNSYSGDNSRRPSEHSSNFSHSQIIRRREQESRAATELIKANKLIQLSKGYMERCFLKFENFFMLDKKVLKKMKK
jgi:hypothetical protein